MEGPARGLRAGSDVPRNSSPCSGKGVLCSVSWLGFERSPAAVRQRGRAAAVWLGRCGSPTGSGFLFFFLVFALSISSYRECCPAAPVVWTSCDDRRLVLIKVVVSPSCFSASFQRVASSEFNAGIRDQDTHTPQRRSIMDFVWSKSHCSLLLD